MYDNLRQVRDPTCTSVSALSSVMFKDMFQ